ncbi:hypothetical protein [Streptacidiphilus cavernicola]|uniref:Uncharacterized protein n=1 Tax=Streptacidiphilus cavernicola TaxID=3342716 RepID=A0ABV6VRN2_9ACTN
MPVSAAHGYPADYLQSECLVGHKDPGFVHGCRTCPYPGYQHPVLGWQPRPCACPHHDHTTEEATT